MTTTAPRKKVPAGDYIEWMTTAEAGEYLGIVPRTLYHFIDEGLIPGYRFGRVIRVKKVDVDEFITASRIQPGDLEHLYPEPAAGYAADDEDEA